MGRSLQQRIAPKLEVADAIRDHHRNIHRALRLAALLEMTNEEKRIQARAVAILEWIGEPWGIAELIQVEDALLNSNGQGGEMDIAQ